VESVLAQTFRDFELLALDDGSTDSTSRLLDSFAQRDSRIRVTRHESNSGLPALRIAQAWQHAQGKYFAYMFDDDFWYPQALSVLVTALETHDSWDMTYANVLFPTVAGAATTRILGAAPPQFDPVLLQASNYIANVAVMLRRETLDRVGTYDPHILIRRICDWDLWLRIASQGTIGHVDRVIGEASGVLTSDSLGHTADMDVGLAQLYSCLDRDVMLRMSEVLTFRIDGLEVFGDRRQVVEARASRQFSAFFRQTGDVELAEAWSRLAVRPGNGRSLRVAAVIVLYEPDESLAENIDACRAEVDLVLAVDNTPRPHEGLAELLAARGVQYMPLGENRGVAAALNLGCQRARELGFEWALTLDQDSTVTPAMVARLCECVELGQVVSGQMQPSASSTKLACHMLPAPEQVALVAPVWQQVGGIPVDTRPECWPVDETLTSGSLTRLSALAELGWFREDLFIDRVDIEYCMRAQLNGWHILQRLDAVLVHRMGQLRRVTFPVSCFVTDYPPLRRYYMVRNVLELRRLYRHEFPAWIRRERQYWSKELVKVLLFEPDRAAKVLMMLRGLLDFGLGRFGSYQENHPADRSHGWPRWTTRGRGRTGH
jgi:rhamnosyltransferase